MIKLKRKVFKMKYRKLNRIDNSLLLKRKLKKERSCMELSLKLTIEPFQKIKEVSKNL